MALLHDLRCALGRVVGALVLFVVVASTAFAQPASDVQAQYDAAFQEMLKKPADLDVLFKFAALATQTGDLEGAVAALERMLIIDPNLPRVRLELGVLYYRLGSYEVARTYLEGALKAPTVPPDVRAKAEQFLDQVNKQRSPSRFSGEFFLGLRYQSNANLGPADSSVRLFGQVANLNQQAQGTSDWGGVGSAQIHHIYDFGRQDGTRLESNFTAYANRQFQISQANVSLLDFNTGPRFRAFADTFEDVTFRPFIAGGYVWVNDTSYYGSYGAGVESGILLSDRLRNTTIVAWRQLNYPDTSYLPQNSLFTGIQFSAATNFQFRLSDTVTLYAFGNAQRYQTQQAQWQSYVLAGVGGGMNFRFADPLFKSQLPWSINLSATEQWWTYDMPDPTIDPTTNRVQVDTILSVVLAVPFDERTTFSVSGGRFNRLASVSNYVFTNNDFMVGVNWRF